MSGFVYLNSPISEELSVEVGDVGRVQETKDHRVVVLFLRRNVSIEVAKGFVSEFDLRETGDVHEYKVCDRCFKRLPTQTGFENNRHKKTGITKRPSCRECRKVKDGVKIKASERREWNANKPEEFSLFSCPVCGKPSISGVTTLVLDHCHKSGKVRGWICESCNTGLGRFDDDPEMVTKALEWLNRPL